MSADTKPATNQEQLVGALETIRRVLVTADLNSLRQSVSQVEARVSGELAAVRKETADARAKLSTDLKSKFDEVVSNLAELEKSRDKARDAAFREVEKLAREAVSGTEVQLGELRQQTEARTKSLKAELEKSLDSKDNALRMELGALGQAISTLQLELQQQMERTAQMSALLNNLASVFSGGARVHAPPPAPLMSEENVDSALDRMFSGQDGRESEDNGGS